MRCFIANCLLNPCERGRMSASLLLPSSSSSARERKHKKITYQNKEGVSIHPGAYPQKDDFTYVWVPFYTRRQIAFATHFLIHILLCCTNRQLPANQLWRKKLQQQTHSSLQANLVQYARVTFTVLSTPTQILQAATSLVPRPSFRTWSMRIHVLPELAIRCLHWFQICGPCACLAALLQPARKPPPCWGKTSAACSRSSVMQSGTWKGRII